MHIGNCIIIIVLLSLFQNYLADSISYHMATRNGSLIISIGSILYKNV